jgi:pullulanase/glycogen debranching enzyme
MFRPPTSLMKVKLYDEVMIDIFDAISKHFKTEKHPSQQNRVIYELLVRLFTIVHDRTFPIVVVYDMSYKKISLE